MKTRTGDICAAVGVILATTIVIVGVGIYGQNNCSTKLYTKDWNEARHFARECESDGGTITMRPHWANYDDKPNAVTIICQKN